MRDLKKGILVVLTVTGFALHAAGCGQHISEKNIVSAQNELRDFKKELKATLVAGMQNGPDKAITACNVEAPNIAARHSGSGIEIGRTSHKLRNSANAPADWMEPLLAEFVDGTRDTYAAVLLDDGRFGYVEPIRVEQMCLMCHGSNIPQPIAERIAALYPNDEATGFEEGDFRGLFWITMPLDTD
jgi:hypothetical protein